MQQLLKYVFIAQEQNRRLRFYCAAHIGAQEFLESNKDPLRTN